VPAKPFWWKILWPFGRRFAASGVPVLDRSAVEKLFGVGRRARSRVDEAWEGYQAGRTWLVERSSLLRALADIEASEPLLVEAQRRERLGEHLAEVARLHRARSVRIKVEERVIPGLPTGVQLGAGELVIRFDSFEEMLSRLYAFGQMLAIDEQRVRELVEE
jgi:hypothetical protein